MTIWCRRDLDHDRLGNVDLDGHGVRIELRLPHVVAGQLQGVCHDHRQPFPSAVGGWRLREGVHVLDRHFQELEVAADACSGPPHFGLRLAGSVLDQRVAVGPQVREDASQVVDHRAHQQLAVSLAHPQCLGGGSRAVVGLDGLQVLVHLVGRSLLPSVGAVVLAAPLEGSLDGPAHVGVAVRGQSGDELVEIVVGHDRAADRPRPSGLPIWDRPPV